MTIEEAVFIKDLRVNGDHTWRTIHIEYQLKYVPQEEWYFLPSVKKYTTDRSIPSGNQLIGAELCEEAMKLLGETINDGWN
jgi:hypothetical protein